MLVPQVVENLLRSVYIKKILFIREILDRLGNIANFHY